jgi:lysophospholipase L1-like esterase
MPGYLACVAAGLALSLVAAYLGSTFAPGASRHVARPVAHATTAVSRARWVATWAASPVSATDGVLPSRGFLNQTVRDVIYASVGGDALRVHLSNLFGTRPVTVGAASVGTVLGGPALVPGSTRTLTFDGKKAVTIPRGGTVVSDAVTVTVAPLQDLAISLYLTHATGPVTHHLFSMQTNYVASGDHAADGKATAFTGIEQAWYFATEVDVRSMTADGTVVAFGDSITDGNGSLPGAEDRWPNYLARRLIAAYGDRAPGVVDEGIAGNRVLSGSACFGQSALQRFKRDALSVAGMRAVIIVEGTNDYGFSLGPATSCTTPQDKNVTAADVELGYRRLIAMAHARGVRVYLATITPRGGHVPLIAAVNRWILASYAARISDGVVDFAAAAAMPGYPDRLDVPYNSGDGLHPNDLGYDVMADAIPLAWLR